MRPRRTTNVPSKMSPPPLAGNGQYARALPSRLEAVGLRPGQGGAITVDEHPPGRAGSVGAGRCHRRRSVHPRRQLPGRVVADNILGRPCAASYDGILRVVFADPEIAAAGLPAARAGACGMNTAAAGISLADAITRPWIYETDHLGRHPAGVAHRRQRERPKTNPDPDWIATAQTLLEAGCLRRRRHPVARRPQAPTSQVAELLPGSSIGHK
jgi:hypothetical protein